MRCCWSRIMVAVLVALLALPALLAEASPDAQKGLRRLRLISFTATDAPTEVARARGLFAAQGLEVEPSLTPSSAFQMRGLSQGDFEIASTAFDNVMAWSGREGAEIVAVAHDSRGDSLGLAMFARSEIQSWDDLRGKRLGADAVDTAFALVLRRILLEHGLDLDRGDYELAAVGSTGERFEALRQGAIVAAMLNPPYDTQAEAAGLRRMAGHLEVLPNYPGGVFAVNRAWAERNRDAVIGFLRAWAAALGWVHENPDAALDIVSAAQGVSRDAARSRMVRLPRDAAVDPAGLAAALDLRTRFGFTPLTGPDVGRYYDLAYWRQAMGQ